MKVQALGLQTSVGTSYSQTATTLQGRTTQHTINDGNGLKTVLGPSPIVAADVFDDTGVAPTGVHFTTESGNVFIGKAIASSVWSVSYYAFNIATGVTSWQGDLKFTFPTVANSYTIKGFYVDDSNPSSMTFLFAATHTTLINGGLFGIWGVPASDFAKVSIITYPGATNTGSLNKTVYQMGDAATQGTNTLTVANGVGVDTVGQFAYVLNGAAATPSIYKFTYATPPASVTSGYSNSNFTLKTATLPALLATVLLVNNVQVFTPTAQPAPNSSNNGALCMGWLTSTNLYFAKVSDITSGASTLPSLLTANYADSGGNLTPPSAAFGQYSPYLDKWVIEMSFGGGIVIKYGNNNDPNQKTMGNGGLYIKSELAGTISPSDFSGVTNICLTMMSGWAVMTNGAVGQRGFVAMDLSCDESSTNPSTGQIYASVISPVISGKNITQGAGMAVYYELAKRSVKPTVQYRTSNFSTGPGVGFDATWTTAPKDGDLSGLVNAISVQFRFLFTIMALETSNSPQINEAYMIYNDATQISDNWEGSVNNTTPNGNAPSYTSFRLKTAYASSVPTMYFRAYDDSGNLVASANTSTNPTSFQYTTNNGTSWNALGTVPNTALTTELRYVWATPPGVQVTCSLAES